MALAEPTTIAVKDGDGADSTETTLKTGGGNVSSSGSAGSTLDLEAVLASVPAALVNAFVARGSARRARSPAW